MTAGIAGKSSPTITAVAFVERAAAAYFGLETKVSSPGPACSIPLRPVISVLGEPFSRRAPRAEAIAESFMECGLRVTSIVHHFQIVPALHRKHQAHLLHDQRKARPTHRGAASGGHHNR